MPIYEIESFSDHFRTWTGQPFILVYPHPLGDTLEWCSDKGFFFGHWGDGHFWMDAPMLVENHWWKPDFQMPDKLIGKFQASGILHPNLSLKYLKDGELHFLVPERTLLTYDMVQEMGDALVKIIEAFRKEGPIQYGLFPDWVTPLESYLSYDGRVVDWLKGNSYEWVRSLIDHVENTHPFTGRDRDKEWELDEIMGNHFKTLVGRYYGRQ